MVKRRALLADLCKGVEGRDVGLLGRLGLGECVPESERLVACATDLGEGRRGSAGPEKRGVRRVLRWSGPARGRRVSDGEEVVAEEERTSGDMAR